MKTSGQKVVPYYENNILSFVSEPCQQFHVVFFSNSATFAGIFLVSVIIFILKMKSSAYCLVSRKLRVNTDKDIRDALCLTDLVSLPHRQSFIRQWRPQNAKGLSCIVRKPDLYMQNCIEFHHSYWCTQNELFEKLLANFQTQIHKRHGRPASSLETSEFYAEYLRRQQSVFHEYTVQCWKRAFKLLHLSFKSSAFSLLQRWGGMRLINNRKQAHTSISSVN